MGETLEGVEGRAHPSAAKVPTLSERVERLEEVLFNSNPLAAFEGGREVLASLWDENARLVAENCHLREALADVHRNAEAVVLLSKLAMGEER